jgi:hypothetical protein
MTEPNPEPTVYVNPDGTFADNWKESLPEEIRAEDSLNFKDVGSLAKSFVDTKKMVGAKGVLVPKEDAKPEEWDAFYTAIGRPQTLEDYPAEVSEELQGIFTPERIDAARKWAYENGITKKQFDSRLKLEMAETVKFLEAEEEKERQDKANAEQTLRDRFKGAYDERMHVANLLVAETFQGKDEAKLAFLEKYGNDPDFIEFASTVGARLVESKALVASLTQDTPGEAKDKIKELEAKLINPSTPADQKLDIDRQLKALYKVAYPEPQPEKAFVGLGG